MQFAAVSIFLLVGTLGMSVDLGSTFSNKGSIQSASDAAVIAAVALVRDTAIAPADLPGAMINEAKTVAAANGLSNSEIAAATLTLGHWDADAKVWTENGNPTNAMTMTAQRIVPTLFAKLLGQQYLSPKVTSRAAIGPSLDGQCVIPFGISMSALGLDPSNPGASLDSLHVGDIISVGDSAPGNWGKLELYGKVNSSGDFFNAVVSPNCSKTVAVGETYDPSTGFAGIIDAFSQRLATNPDMVMPVVNAFPNGGGSNNTCTIGAQTGVPCPTIQKFLKLTMLSEQNQGSNWSITLKIIDANNVGSHIGGDTVTGPHTYGRVLVQ